MTQFVIAEVIVSNLFQQSYTFAGFIALMDSRGFVLMDVLDGIKPAMNQGVIFIDALFARPD
jgi:hypothetical protein